MILDHCQAVFQELNLLPWFTKITFQLLKFMGWHSKSFNFQVTISIFYKLYSDFCFDFCFCSWLTEQLTSQGLSQQLSLTRKWKVAWICVLLLRFKKLTKRNPKISPNHNAMMYLSSLISRFFKIPLIHTLKFGEVRSFKVSSN